MTSASGEFSAFERKRGLHNVDAFLADPPKCLNYPRLAVLDRNSIVTGDWSGEIIVSDLQSLSVKHRINAYYRSIRELLGPTSKVGIYGISIAPTKRHMCAVATRSAFCLLWRIGESDYQELFSSEGAVNCVCYSPD